MKLLCALLVVAAAAAQASDAPDTRRDILVTITDHGARNVSTGVNAPYRMRKRYPTEADTLRAAAAIADDYELAEIDRWPIRALEVLCIVFRVGPDRDRDDVLRRLRSDARIDSAQRLQEFETQLEARAGYDDTYNGLQRALSAMDVPAAHRYTRGDGIRVAIIDSHADAEHEDLDGRVRKLSSLIDSAAIPDASHGTAVASVIAATANNARGIVGVAPEATLEIYVACRREVNREQAVCDSFTLAKALDEIVASRPDIINLSLTGPWDPLLAELLAAADRAGIVAVAARAADGDDARSFPANLPRVIGVASSDDPVTRQLPDAVGNPHPEPGIFAPGRQIMVALPHNGYDFRSGNSLAAAHVSGVVALLLSVSPALTFDTVQAHLVAAHRSVPPTPATINACAALMRIDIARDCP